MAKKSSSSSEPMPASYGGVTTTAGANAASAPKEAANTAPLMPNPTGDMLRRNFPGYTPPAPMLSNDERQAKLFAGAIQRRQNMYQQNKFVPNNTPYVPYRTAPLAPGQLPAGFVAKQTPY